MRERLRAGDTLIGTFLNLGSPLAAEICGRAGFDWALVDLEHGSGSEGSMVYQLQALAAAGTSGLVRVESQNRSRIGKALDAGAVGIMAPRVESPAQAERVVAGTRYPPAGTRGVALMNRGAGFGAAADLEASAEQILLVVQIETAAGVGAAASVAATDGVDVLFVGPADLSHSLGVFGRFDDDAFRSAVRTVAHAAEQHGKTPGVLAGSAEDADRYLAEGYRFVGISGDGGFLAKGARLAATSLRARLDGRRPTTKFPDAAAAGH